MSDRERSIIPASQRFRDDIDPATTWVTSDTHFGHTNIVGYCHRPDEHEEVMLAEWRRVVPDDATVVHLGDLSYGHNGGDSRFKHIIAPELTGKRKILIRGNHDRKNRQHYVKCGFKLARPFSIKYDWTSPVTQLPSWMADVSFSHYPWSEAEEGREQQPHEYRLHGHIHNNGYTRTGYVPFLRNHINLSVEQTRYTPVNLKELLDAALFGIYSETTEEQLAEVAARKEERQS